MRTLLVLTALTFATIGYSADTSAKAASKSTTTAGQKIEFHDEVDKTDVLSIPYDTSEQDIQQEEKKLEDLQKSEQNKKLKELKEQEQKYEKNKKLKEQEQKSEQNKKLKELQEQEQKYEQNKKLKEQEQKSAQTKTKTK